MDFKKLIPHAIAAGIILFVAMVFFAPNAFEGKVLPQPDNDKARGMQTEIQDYIKKGEPSPLWTNSAFGGMPSYQIYVNRGTDMVRPLAKAPFLWTGVSSVWAQIFGAMLVMYFFLAVLGLRWQTAIFGALGVGITSYNIDILEAGHTTKMMALAMAPGMFAGTVLIGRGRLMLGAGVLALFTAMQLYVSHVQITYYTLIIIGLYLLSLALKGDWLNWGKAIGVAALALTLGFSTNAAKLLTTLEYGSETIRGKSDLAEKAGKGDGLDKEYLFGWSCGIAESMTLLVPHFAGGGSNESYKDTKLYKAVPAENRRGIGGLFYTGEQPFVGTAIYMGAVICFLFFLGAFLVQKQRKWWLIAATALMISLAWGKHFFLNDIFYDYLPMFNKFRAVTMAFGMAQMTAAILAALGLQAFFSAEVEQTKKQRALFISAGITAGLALLAIMIAPDAGANDEALAQNPQLLKLLLEDRSNMVRSDAFRSIGFILVAAGLLWLYLKEKLSVALAALAITAVSLIDNWGICARTISGDKYTAAKAAAAPPTPEKFDQQIMADKDIHYRVLDLARGGITANATNSYFHKSINGYHAAKLQRFQEVVDKYLGSTLGQNLHVLGMMNTKYIISQKGDVIPNPEAYGHAWFVKNYYTVADGNEELNALESLNPRDTAVIQASFATALNGFQIQPDSTATIDLVKYHPDKMEYVYTAATDQLALFPEQYYPPSKGWKCYLNGQPYDEFIKADYMLRALKVPAGKDMKLEMRFEPQSWATGRTIGLIGTMLTLLLIGAGLWLSRKKGGEKV